MMNTALCSLADNLLEFGQTLLKFVKCIEP